MAACCPPRAATKDRKDKPRWELADILRAHARDYVRDHRVPPGHLKVMDDIMDCRSSFFGFHVDKCTQCGHKQIAYNSCLNRHCPKCQSLPKARWLEARKSELLPVPYFHVVFTLPHELNPVALCNKKLVCSILFQAASQTLKDFALRRGGSLGFLALLHTWDQTLGHHVHLHCVVPGGMLAADAESWLPSDETYLFPVEALSLVFRAKFIEALDLAFEKAEMVFPGQTAEYATPEGFDGLTARLWGKEWVVYCKPPFAGPEKVLDYLGRYTHRVAISNHRIVDVRDGKVTFHYRDRKNNDRAGVMTLDAGEVIRRFLLHVLPKGLMRIRHFGLFANRYKERNLTLCRRLLNLCPLRIKPPQKTTQELMLELTGKDISCCPLCGGPMLTVFKTPCFTAGHYEDHYSQPPILDSS
ncbi:MAG: IS91 family transposase [Pseudomonadota bacterium]